MIHYKKKLTRHESYSCIEQTHSILSIQLTRFSTINEIFDDLDELLFKSALVSENVIE